DSGLDDLVLMINSGQSGAITGQPPTIDSLTVSPGTAARGDLVTLTANGVSDGARGVIFAVDVNSDGIIDKGDFPLGADLGAANGFSVARRIPRNVDAGQVTILAMAKDSHGQTSNVVSGTLTITNAN